jgi:hypothetical protein
MLAEEIGTGEQETRHDAVRLQAETQEANPSALK